MLLLAGSISGCGSLGYLAHLGLGQARVLLDRETLTPTRIEKLSGAERRGLDWLTRARAHAESLGLSHSTSYRHVIERSPIHVVVAAPPDRLELATWWFPFAGRVAYRGYFDSERAQRFAQGLAEQGLDTLVRPALLYSTLGFFDDPIPLEVLGWSEIDLVDVVIHELVHETVFVPGDTAYNEALATFIAERATLALFAGNPAREADARKIFEDRRSFALLLDALAEELTALYSEIASPEEARRRREPVFKRFQTEVFQKRTWRTQRYAGFPQASLSNAYLGSHRTYTATLPCLEQQLTGLAEDLEEFIRLHRDEPERAREGLASCRAR